MSYYRTNNSVKLRKIEGIRELKHLIGDYLLLAGESAPFSILDFGGCTG